MNKFMCSISQVYLPTLNEYVHHSVQPEWLWVQLTILLCVISITGDSCVCPLQWNLFSMDGTMGHWLQKSHGSWGQGGVISVLSLLFFCGVALEEGLYLIENQSPHLVMQMLILDSGCKDYICSCMQNFWAFLTPGRCSVNISHFIFSPFSLFQTSLLQLPKTIHRVE